MKDALPMVIENPMPTAVWPDTFYEFDVTMTGEEMPDLAVRWGGYQVLNPGEPANEHVSFRFAYIVLVLTGNGSLTCGEKTWDFRPGTIFWVGSGQTSRWGLRPGSPAIKHFTILPFGKEINKWFDQYLGTTVGAAPLINPEAIERLFQVLMDEGIGGGDFRDDNCRALLEVMLRRLSNQLAVGRALGSNARESYFKARRYIQSSFSTIRELGEVAQNTGVSVSYLCHLFDRFANSTAFDYLTKLKLSKAARLLCTSNLSIREVGQAVGYEQLHHFSRNFKKRYGVSPSLYRKSHWAESERTP